jgi:hypothetical protein
LSLLKVLLNLNEAVCGIALSTHPGTRDPNSVDDVVNHDASDQATLGALFFQVDVKIGHGLGFGQRVVSSQKNRPEARVGQVRRVDKGGIIGVLVNEAADSGIHVHQLIVPSRDSHISDVDWRARKRGTRGKRTRRSSVVRGSDSIAEAAVFIATVGRGGRIVLSTLVVSSVGLRRRALIRVSVRLRIEFRGIGSVSTAVEATTWSIAVEHGLSSRTVGRRRSKARLTLHRSRRRPLAEAAITWRSR